MGSIQHLSWMCASLPSHCRAQIIIIVLLCGTAATAAGGAYTAIAVEFAPTISMAPLNASAANALMEANWGRLAVSMRVCASPSHERRLIASAAGLDCGGTQLCSS